MHAAPSALATQCDDEMRPTDFKDTGAEHLHHARWHDIGFRPARTPVPSISKCKRSICRQAARTRENISAAPASCWHIDLMLADDTLLSVLHAPPSRQAQNAHITIDMQTSSKNKRKYKRSTCIMLAYRSNAGGRYGGGGETAGGILGWLTSRPRGRG